MEIIITSTAERIIREQAARGRDRAAIGPGDLAETYALHRDACAAAGYPRPDFATARAMLPAVAADAPRHEGPVGVIVETRDHPALEPVIEEVVSQLQIPVQLFHGRANAEAARRGRLADLVSSNRLHLSALDDTAPLNVARYNALMMLPEFWERTIGRGKILVFQTDAILCPASPYRLNDFLDFDYIGSPFRQREWHGIAFGGGNGGLSLHSWDRTMECLHRFPPETWPSAEDRYFGFHMEFVGRTGGFRDCVQFAAQREFLYPSFGAHNVREMDRVDLARFLAYCPEGVRTLRSRKTPSSSLVGHLKRTAKVMWMRGRLARGLPA